MALHLMKHFDRCNDICRGDVGRHILRKESPERSLDNAWVLSWCEEVRGKRLAVEDALQDGVEVARVPKVAEAREVVLQGAAVVWVG